MRHDTCGEPTGMLGSKSTIHGFTLIEIAIVLVIVGLLLGGLLMPLATQVDIERRKQTETALNEIREALIGFAVTNQRLPCPDTTGDGVADPATPGNPKPWSCPSAEGWIPWSTLGVAQADAWGNRFRYRVSAQFTDTAVTPCVPGDNRIGLCDDGNIAVNTRTSTKAAQALVATAAAVVLSHGKNGFGATSASGVAQPAPAAGTDELANTNNDNTFFARTPTAASTPCSETAAGQPYCEFDDIVVWLAPNILFNRMVAAGVLP